MADAGQMLAQLQGNGFLQYYAQGAQIAAGITSLNQKIAADTFQNNLNSVNQAMQQSQQQFQNQLQARELQVHVQNAETERMFANQKLDPQTKLLNNALIQSKTDYYHNRANQQAAPTYQGPPGADEQVVPVSGGTTVNSSGLPNVGGAGGPYAQSNPNRTMGADGFYPNPGTVATPVNQGASNQVVAAPGAGPGIVPVQNGMPLDVSDSAYHQTGGAYQGQGSAVTPPQQPALAAALDAAKNHQEQYGQSWQDSLNPDNDPSPAELASAQAIANIPGSGPTPQPLEGTLNDVIKQQAGNPLLQPGLDVNRVPQPAAAPVTNPPVPATKDGAQAAPSAPPIQQDQPKPGFFNKGNGVAYKVSQDAKGNLVQTNYTWDGKIPKGSATAIGWVPSKARPEIVWSPNADHASEITIDGKTYVKEGFNIGTNGDVTSSHYKLKSGGDGTVNVTTSTAPSGQRYDVITDASGKILKTDRVIPQRAPTEAKLSMPNFDTNQRLDDLVKAASNPPGKELADQVKAKSDAYEAKYGRPPKTEAEWRTAHNLAVQPAINDLRDYVAGMQKARQVIVLPQRFQYLIPQTSGNPASPPSGVQTGNSKPSWMAKYGITPPSNAQ